MAKTKAALVPLVVDKVKSLHGLRMSLRHGPAEYSKATGDFLAGWPAKHAKAACRLGNIEFRERFYSRPILRGLPGSY